MIRTMPGKTEKPAGAGETPLSPSPPVRLQNVDRLRAVAITFVVAFHLNILPADATRIGVTSFFLIGLMFRARKPLDLSTPGPILERARRLLVPWVVWSLVYGVLRLVKVWTEKVPYSEVFDPWMPAYGTSPHLWFLPWLFVLEIVTSLVARIGRFVPERVRALFWFACAVAYVVFAPIPVRYGNLWLVSKWAMALVAVPVALGFAELLKRRPIHWLALLAILLAGWALTSEVTQTIAWCARYSLAASLLALALIRPGRRDRVTRIVTDSIMGVYLLHPIVKNLLGPVAHWPYAIGLVAVLLASFAATRLLKLTPVRHVL